MRNRRSFYFSPRLVIRKTCGANDEDEARRRLSQLAPLEGTMPPPSPKGILYTACNAPYLDLYVRDLIRSASLHSPDHHFHFHLFDPTDAAMASLQEQIDSGHLTVSWEHTHKAATPILVSAPIYYQVCRFIRMWQFVESCRSPMFLVDADALIRNDVSKGFEAQRSKDVAMFLRVKHKNIRRRVLAAAFMAMPTKIGLRFLRDCSACMVPHVQKPSHEPIDQMLLYFVWRWFKKHVDDFNCGALAKTYSDWDYDSESYVWHAKGSRKKDPMPLEQIFSQER